MQNRYVILILVIGSTFLDYSCKHDHAHNPDGSHPEESAHAHNTDGSHPEEGQRTNHDLEPISVTKRTELIELFVEFNPLIVGKASRFAAHFSDMKSFQPISKGEVSVRLLQNGKTVSENSAKNPSSPGIFNLIVTPTITGSFNLEFSFKTSNSFEEIIVPNIRVYESQEEAKTDILQVVHDGDKIPFSKEQAWKTEFSIVETNRQTIHEVIRTSGEIQPIKGKEQIVSARSSGIVFYKNTKLQIGREIRKGEPLFIINSQGLLQSNITEKVNIAKAKIAKAKADFLRAENLMSEQIIGQKEYEKRKMEYAIADAEWQTLSNSNKEGGQSVVAPMSGIIKNLMISDGEFAEEGTPLLEISNTRRLILHADLSQDYRSKLNQITTAKFKTSYQQKVQSLEDYNGKLISVGKVLEDGKHFLPVWFELDNVNDLVPGSYVELFLLTKPIEQQLVIPKTAIMQDYDVNYVYVQTAGELFEKKEVHLGIDDGERVQVLSGISDGDWVVTKGAYQIKMASMSSNIPAHGHAH